MIKCQTCGSTRFTKESNYLICEYCGTHRKTDPLVLEKKTQLHTKYFLVVLMAAVIGTYLLNNGQKDQERTSHEVQEKSSIVSTSSKEHNTIAKFINHPKITVKNDTSTIGTQVIQTTEDLVSLSVNNYHSQIDTQLIQSKKSMNLGHQYSHPEASKAILLSSEKKVYNSKGEILSHTKKIHHHPKENYVDKDGIRHRTVYTKQPKIKYRNGHLNVDNSGIKIESQQVSFYVDENGVKHYHALTKGVDE